jgi:hypothetical protein
MKVVSGRTKIITKFWPKDLLGGNSMADLGTK